MKDNDSSVMRLSWRQVLCKCTRVCNLTMTAVSSVMSIHPQRKCYAFCVNNLTMTALSSVMVSSVMVSSVMVSSVMVSNVLHLYMSATSSPMCSPSMQVL